MRERTRLDRGVNGYLRIERDLKDALDLIELAESEGDQAMVAEGERTLAALHAEAGQRRADAGCGARADQRR